MKKQAWLTALLFTGVPVLAAEARPERTIEQTWREVRSAAAALQQADRASARELLEYTEDLTRLAAAQAWAVKEGLRVLEARLARLHHAREARAAAPLEDSLPGLEQAARRLRTRRLEDPVTTRRFDALVARARKETLPGEPVQGALDTVAHARAVQAGAAGALQALHGRVTTRLEALEDTREAAAQRAVLGALRDQVVVGRSEAARLLEELKQAERALSLAASDLLPAPAGSAFGALRGRLPMPTEGHVEEGFGLLIDPRFDTAVVHQGLDIRAPRGSPVRAVARGAVVYAGWVRGYGNVLIVDHGSGYHTVMAHLDVVRCSVGQAVEAGQELGTVGETGSLKGPSLYFEVRRRGEAVDPADWLRLPGVGPHRLASGRSVSGPARPATPRPPRTR